ncbi:MAG TPA: hypothetical protein VM843_00420 [Flavisolibacter sp.]|nr:hypothetical protein [Flavisolibacter sp.]
MHHLFLLFATFSLLVSVAQDNNPYDFKGLQYIESIKTIKHDFNAGTVKDFTEESLQYYSNLVPLKNGVHLDLATSLTQTLKNKDLDFTSIVDDSILTPNSKQLYREIYDHSVRLDAAGFRDYLRKKVEIIKSSKIAESERESLLSLAAILYHGVAAGSGCATTITTAEGVMVDDSGTGCVVLGMAVGYLVGNIICGTLCGICGAIVGGIIGALT